MTEPANQTTGDSGKQRVPTATGSIAEQRAASTASKSSTAEKPHLGDLKKWIEMAAVILGLIGAALAGKAYIDDTIDKTVAKKLSDETILRRIAAQSRPSLIFDGNESIISDLGASQFIKELQITKWSGQGWPELVHIDFTRHFATAPMMTPMYDTVAIIPKRAKGFGWDFEIGTIIEITDKDKSKRVYRLELAP